MKKLIFTLSILFSLFAVTAQAQEEAEADSVGYIVKVGDMAPDFTAVLTDGSKVTLSELRGR